MNAEPRVKWISHGHDPVTNKCSWQLMVNRGRGKWRKVADVWSNGTWHTWNQNGEGGENDVELTVERAKVEAAASAIEQGFI